LTLTAGVVGRFCDLGLGDDPDRNEPQDDPDMYFSHDSAGGGRPVLSAAKKKRRVYRYKRQFDDLAADRLARGL